MKALLGLIPLIMLIVAFYLKWRPVITLVMWIRRIIKFRNNRKDRHHG